MLVSGDGEEGGGLCTARGLLLFRAGARGSNLSQD